MDKNLTKKPAIRDYLIMILAKKRLNLYAQMTNTWRTMYFYNNQR